MMPEIILRKQAKSLGLKWYFTGKPCCHGHLCERTTNHKTCVACNRSKTNAWRKNHAEAWQKIERRSYQNRKHKLVIYARQRRIETREHCLAYRRRYYAKHLVDILEQARLYERKKQALADAALILLNIKKGGWRKNRKGQWLNGYQKQTREEHLAARARHRQKISALSLAARKLLTQEKPI